MPQKRGGSHTTLTETAAVVVQALKKMPDIKMIAPGVIDARRSGPRHITAVFTNAGLELLISGQGVQKVAVHLRDPNTALETLTELQTSKHLRAFTWATRTRKPGI
jgi:hypothetical protein